MIQEHQIGLWGVLIGALRCSGRLLPACLARVLTRARCSCSKCSCGDLEHTPEEAQPVRAVIDLAERYAEIFFGEAKMRLSSIDRTRINPDMLAPVAESGHRLASTLRRLDAPLAHITERSEDLRSLGRRASELANHQ